MTMSAVDHRATLRQHYRALRRALSPSQQTQAAQDVVARCINDPTFLTAKTIAFYLANDGEIDSQYLLEYCWQQGKTTLLPLLDPHLPGHLVFIEHQAAWPLTSNKYGIAEPQYNTDKVVELHAIDIIFTPLVAFDTQGNRLGMGGGYYDRTLAALNTDRHSTQVIGLAHDCQQADNLPKQAWDIPLHGIITPSQIFTLKGSV